MRFRFIPYSALAILVVACGDNSATPASDSSDAGTVSDATLDDAQAPDGHFAMTGDAAIDVPVGPPAPDEAVIGARVDALLAQMTLDEKVGQMTQAGYKFLTSIDDLSTMSIGSLLAGGGDAPGVNQPQDWLNLTATFRAKAAASRLKIPLLFGIDAVHGNAKVRGATVFPHNIGMGCSRDPDIVRRSEAVTAAEVRAIGAQWTFSPDLDVGRDERWGRTYESYGEDPALVSLMGAAAVNGYQGVGVWAPGGVLACAKHALGAGGTTWGTGVDGGIDEGDTQLSEADMRAIHLPPYKAAIDAGVQTIMVSYSSWNGAKMSGSAKWLTQVIKGELGFKGFLISDYGALYQLPGTHQAQIVASINAGMDMVMVPQNYVEFISDVKAGVASGAIAQSRVDDATRRILRVKILMGLLDAPEPDASGIASVGSSEHRAIAREAVSKSLVLLKNDNATLPLSKTAHFHIAGLGANDLGIQSGGWTLGWQGKAGIDATAMGGGTTILDAFRSAVASPSTQISYSADGTGAPPGSIGIVVVHELPYAEMLGDTPDPSLNYVAKTNIYDGTSAGVIANMTASNIPLVLVVISGRPIRIESLLPKFNAVVAAWLPGSEGAGITDVLFGDKPFTGKLSKSWPKDGTQFPLTHDQPNYAPLFPFGFGL